MDTSFEGLDPVLRLYNKLKIPISSDVGSLHPVLRIAGIISQRGAVLDFAVKIPTEIYEEGTPTIIMVGCGGTGSHLLPNILQYIGTKSQKTGREMPNIILVDGDEVEKKNLVRQRFSPQDLGRSKADALASRYSGVFGTKITAVTKYLTSSDEIEELVNIHGSTGPLILIGAVDNNRARSIMYDYYLGTFRRIFWVDSGNDAWHGQAILGTRNLRNKPDTVHWSKAQLGQGGVEVQAVDLPCFFDEVPNEFLAIGNTPATPQNECALMVEEDPQTIQANMLSAQCASSLVIQILEGTIRTMSMNFDALTGNIKAKVVTRTNIAQGLAAQKSSRSQILAFVRGLFSWSDGDKMEDFLPAITSTSGLCEDEHWIAAQ